MERTAIKIPGKNTRDQSKAAIAVRKALNRPRGRPLKLTPSVKKIRSSSFPAVHTSKSKKRSLKNIKSKHKMSNLERLPTELLENIFVYCMNLDLPRSSPIIGAKLSSEIIYTRTVMSVFGPTWEDGFGHHRPPPEMLSSERGVGEAELQSAILRCRWASLPILQKSQELWIERNGRDGQFVPLPFIIHEDPHLEQQIEKKRFDSNITPANFFEEDFMAFSDFVLRQSHNQSLVINNWDSYSWDSYIDVANGVEIPGSLLLGPWTEEKVRNLYWIVKAGAKLDWLTSTSGEAAMLGFKTAVSIGDSRVVHLLLWAGLKEKIDEEAMIWVLHNTGSDKTILVIDILDLCFGRARGVFKDSNKMGSALAEIKDKAEEASDNERLAFVEAINRSLWVF